MKTLPMLINGEWVAARSGQTRPVTDPANSELLAQVPESGAEDAALAITAAREAFDNGPWRSTPPLERGKLLFKVSQAIMARFDEFVECEVRDCGKPRREAEFDVTDAANCFEYYGGLATKIHGQTFNTPDGSVSMVVREPIGVCAQIVPWNYPLLMASWKLAPALAAGNCVILKPSELTPLSALKLGEIFTEAGFPPGVVNIITGPGAGAGEEMTRNPLVDKIAFTGGTVTGRKVMQHATENLNNVTLELGGKNPVLVFEDCNFDSAVDWTLFAAFANQGEVCSAGSRLLVQKSIHRKFVDELVRRVPRIKLGHGLDEGVVMGPLVSAAHREKVEAFIQAGIDEGASLLCGGKRPEGDAFARGNFLEPTVFDHVTPDMRIAREEIFGPVLSVIPFETEEEAVALANDTAYGLAAGVFTSNITRGHRVVRQLRAGITWINNYHPTYNEMPWGGYKQSGIGRELGLFGIEAYLETKQINLWMDDQPVGWY